MRLALSSPFMDVPRRLDAGPCKAGDGLAAIGDATFRRGHGRSLTGLDERSSRTCRIRKTAMGEALTRVSKALTAAGASIEADMLSRSKPNQSVGPVSTLSCPSRLRPVLNECAHERSFAPKTGRLELAFALMWLPKRGAMSETRKLAAILVSDVVGYSRLAGADEDRILVARVLESVAVF
jgi:hypothetical protein